MGCDIHMVLERRIAGKWLGIDAFKGHHRAYAKIGDIDWSSPAATSRNYERFGKLANVRTEGPEPRGIPEDISQLTSLEIESWAGDGHSHSWLPLKEAVSIFLATHRGEVDAYIKKYPESYFFGIDSGHNLDDFRLVFWFDN